MKLSNLLATREFLIRQANLANMAFAFTTLKGLADRIESSRLTGLVALRQADESEDQYWASLTALELRQSVIEEHFSEDDVTEMADAISFSTATEFSEMNFRLEHLDEPLRCAVESGPRKRRAVYP